MPPLRRLAAALATAGVLTITLAGPATAGSREDDSSQSKTDTSTAQKATAVEYGLIVGLVAVA